MEKIPTEQEIRYDIARKRVKKIKDFYIHLLIYICINIFVVFVNISNLKPGESYFQIQNFLTAFFWGIGIVCHAFSVFGIDIVFGKNWEERKIKEIMDKNQPKKWQ